jgi:hypothetical protein
MIPISCRLGSSRSLRPRRRHPAFARGRRPRRCRTDLPEAPGVRGGAQRPAAPGQTPREVAGQARVPAGHALHLHRSAATGPASGLPAQAAHRRGQGPQGMRLARGASRGAKTGHVLSRIHPCTDVLRRASFAARLVISADARHPGEGRDDCIRWGEGWKGSGGFRPPPSCTPAGAPRSRSSSGRPSSRFRRACRRRRVCR